jgi:hypothetical protein
MQPLLLPFEALHRCRQPSPLDALHCRRYSTHSIQRTALPLPAIATWRTPLP